MTETREATAEEIAELEALLSAATPGPWVVINDPFETVIVKIDRSGDIAIVDASWRGPQVTANAALIVAARNHLPGILSRLAAAEAALASEPKAGLTTDERLIWLLGDLMNAAENYFGAENPKRLGHINCSAIRIIDEILTPLRTRAEAAEAANAELREALRTSKDFLDHIVIAQVEEEEHRYCLSFDGRVIAKVRAASANGVALLTLEAERVAALKEAFDALTRSAIAKAEGRVSLNADQSNG